MPTLWSLQSISEFVCDKLSTNNSRSFALGFRINIYPSETFWSERTLLVGGEVEVQWWQWQERRAMFTLERGRCTHRFWRGVYPRNVLGGQRCAVRLDPATRLRGVTPHTARARCYLCYPPRAARTSYTRWPPLYVKSSSHLVRWEHGKLLVLRTVDLQLIPKTINKLETWRSQ